MTRSSHRSKKELTQDVRLLTKTSGTSMFSLLKVHIMNFEGRLGDENGKTEHVI